MNSDELKRILARVSLAGLITVGGMTLSSCACATVSNDKQGEKAEVKGAAAHEEEQRKTSCGGGTSCG